MNNAVTITEREGRKHLVGPEVDTRGGRVEGLQINNFIEFPFTTTGFNEDRPAELSRLVSEIVNHVIDPDFKNDAERAGLSPKLALTVADLGLLLYGDINAKDPQTGKPFAFVVVGLTTLFCPHADSILATVKKGLEAGLRSFLVDPNQGGLILSPNDVKVLHQGHFLELLGPNLQAHRYALSWHEGWITSRGEEKLCAVKEELVRRAASRSLNSETETPLLETVERFLHVREKLREAKRGLPTVEDAFSEQYFRQLNDLTLYAAKVRQEWEKTHPRTRNVAMNRAGS